MRPQLGTTVYCRSTGQPWTVASVGEVVTLRSRGGQFRRWRLDRYSPRRPYRARRPRTPVQATTAEQAPIAVPVDIVRLAASLGLTVAEVERLRGG